MANWAKWSGLNYRWHCIYLQYKSYSRTWKTKMCIFFSLNFISQFNTFWYVNWSELENLSWNMTGCGTQWGEANTKNVIIHISKYKSRFLGKTLQCELLRTPFKFLHQLVTQIHRDVNKKTPPPHIHSMCTLLFLVITSKVYF